MRKQPFPITVYKQLTLSSVYSAHEFSIIPRNPIAITSASDTQLSISTHTNLPLDITIETLASVLILCIGVVLGAQELKPIQWRVWAGRLEREKRQSQVTLDSGFVENPYRALDERAGFLDIRSRRKEFAAWIREGGKDGKA